jgi:hypothetical protein
MVHKIVMLFFVFILCSSSLVNAQSNKNIEIFDIQKDEIIKTVSTSFIIQLEVQKYIKEINNIVRKLKLIPDKGYIIKIPLEPSVQLENQWMNALIDEVIIIIPEAEEPYLLTFDNENKPWFFTFETRIDTLITTLEFAL